MNIPLIKISRVWVAIILCFLLNHSAISQEDKTTATSARSIINFDRDWKFFKGDVKGAEMPDFEDSKWEILNLPHDWEIDGPLVKGNQTGTQGGFFPLGIGWYRKHFILNSESNRGKVFIQFDGVHKNSDVWINGHYLGNRWYGYVSFQYDLTPYLNNNGQNLIAVRVDNSDQTSRWYTGSGIYRHVWLNVTNSMYIAHWGTYITTPEISQTSAKVKVRTEVKNERSEQSLGTLKTEILDSNGKIVTTVSSNMNIENNQIGIFKQELIVPNPVLWSVLSPTLYHARVTLSDTNKIIDVTETAFGIRSIEWNPDHGLLVNGKPEKMNGVCLHHDLGCLGAAFMDRAMERRLEILKSMGCNAIRMSHNPPAPQLLDMCDRMGFLVIDEAFDKWSGKYYPHFERDWQKDLSSMIRRDWNHPSIVLWSVGNEVSEQTKEKGSNILKMLTDFVHELDPSRKVTCAAFPRLSFDFVKATDVIGLNYQEQWFEQYRQDSPNSIIVSTEAYPYYSGKGDSHKNFNPVNPYLKILEKDYYAGSFIWTGIDYLGEAVAGWPFHGWNCSLVDTCGFRRPISYFHESVWSDKPVVYIAVIDDSVDAPEPVKDHWGWPKMVSHWNLPQLNGKQVKVVTFTNCPEVELFINGKSMGTKELKDFPDRMITWMVPYDTGRIEARGIDQGHIMNSYQLQTAGKPVKINLTPDQLTIRADGQDLCYIEVQITDENGILVPDADHEIQFSLDGPGMIIGVDNGDLTNVEPYKAEKRKAFHGKALVAVQSTMRSGQIVLKAKAEGLPETKILIESIE